MKLSIKSLLYVTLMLTLGVFNSCVDKDYDDLETANVDPNLTATHTIAEFQALLNGNVPMLITDDIIIAGVVTGDDLTGNIYKKLILQQDSSGVAIQLDISNFNALYPTGRRIFVKCKGLYFENNGGNFELGTSPGSTMGRIPAGLAPKYLVKGMWGQYITPKVYTFSDPNIPTNTLVQFNDIQFDCDFSNIAYAASSPANLDMIDCNGDKLILYSSTFATFALLPTPGGKGSIVGVYTIYSGAGELQIRDTSDVQMTGLRCDGTTGVPNLINLTDVRALDPGAANALDLPCNLKIQVTMISDYIHHPLDQNNQNCYVQDGTAGIQIRFDNTHAYPVGTALEINVSGVELSTYRGVLQLYNVPISNVTVIGTGSVTPTTATIADINLNYNTWEGTLVTINGVTITGTGTYNGAAGVNTLTDATGSVELYTGTGATFKNIAYPVTPVSVTGILTEYNGTYEVMIRDTTDVH